jgi:dethiobiotin synthetase
MTAPAWFVTGTDTGVGKTLLTQAWLLKLRDRHARVAGMKPVAAGAIPSTTLGADGPWDNDDVVALREASSMQLPAALVNPYLLRAAVSPHIAARREGVVIELARIVDACRALRTQADAVLVEGAGGFRVPLSEHLDGSDLALALGLPVLLVVGLRLGCLNHALLTAEAITARGLTLAGWVGNQIDPGMPEVAANVALLADRLGAPCLGVVPWQAQPDPVATAALLQLPVYA